MKRIGQVNALIMGPAGYKVKDFVKSGGTMTVLFLIVSLTMLNIVFEVQHSGLMLLASSNRQELDKSLTGSTLIQGIHMTSAARMGSLYQF